MNHKNAKNWLLPGVWILATPSWAFEHTRVLPKGVRNINFRTVNTDLTSKTDANGQIKPLADPLQQDLTFKKIAKDETPIRAEQLKGFLLSNNFDLNQAVGTFTADLRGKLAVTAPILSYGLTETTTLAVAVPYYQAETSINVGFVPNSNAKAFLAALSKTENNQIASAREATIKLNSAVDRLNNKLLSNDFKALSSWKDAGLGDVTIAAKGRSFANDYLGVATTAGIVAPTGRFDDPDILTDIPFGDGQWDTFGQLACDETLPQDLTFNQFLKYTVQWPGEKAIRQITSEEKIDVERKSVPFKLGDRFEGGTSIVWEPRFGLTAGIGMGFMRKFSDRYQSIDPDSQQELEKNTEARASTAEWSVGYSTVKLYQSGHIPIPMELRLTETKQIQSINSPMTDLIQIDMSLFF